MPTSAIKSFIHKYKLLLVYSGIILYGFVFELQAAEVLNDSIDYTNNSLIADILQYRKELRDLKYFNEDLAFFPQLKIRTNTSSDSALQVKIRWALNIDSNKLKTSEEREEARDILSEVINAILSKKVFEEILLKKPPTITLQNLNTYLNFLDSKPCSDIGSIGVDTNKLFLFFWNESFIKYAKGAKEYDRFIRNARIDPFIDMLVDVSLFDSEKSDTLAILKGLIEKILHADERVKMLAFGYYGLPVAQQIRAKVNGRLNKLKRQQKIISAQDSAWVEFFYSVPFNAFGELFKKYSQMIDSMKIAVRYLPSDKPETFFEAAKIKDYLQK